MESLTSLSCRNKIDIDDDDFEYDSVRVNGSNRKGSKKNYDDDDDEEQEIYNNGDDDDEDLVVFDVKGKGGKPPRPSAVFVSDFVRRQGSFLTET